MARIYVCYAWADVQQVERMVASLERRGHSVWWSPPGAADAPIPEIGLAQLNNVDCLLVFWSAASLKQAAALNTALIAGRAGKLVAVSAPGFDATELPAELQAFRSVPADATEALVHNVEALAQRSAEHEAAEPRALRAKLERQASDLRNLHAAAEREAAELRQRRAEFEREASDLRNFHAAVEREAAELRQRRAEFEREATELRERRSQRDAINDRRSETPAASAPSSEGVTGMVAPSTIGSHTSINGGKRGESLSAIDPELTRQLFPVHPSALLIGDLVNQRRSVRRVVGEEGDGQPQADIRMPSLAQLPQADIFHAGHGATPVAPRAPPPQRPRSSSPASSPSPSPPRRRSRLPFLAGLLATAGIAALAAKIDLKDLAASLLAFLKLNSLPPMPGADPAVVPPPDTVDCSVFAPPQAPPETEFVVQVFLHTPPQFERAELIATKIDEAAKLRGIATLQTEVTRGDRIAITLEGKGLAVEGGVQELVWRGHPQVANFIVTAPAAALGRVFRPIVRLSVGGVPVGFVQFAVDVQASQHCEVEAQGYRARRYTYAFISYASPDRKRVLDYARALRAARIDFFQDILSLEPGQRWSNRLYTEIEKADLFLLFWSKAASESEWVMKEIEYAHDRRRSDAPLPDITPINLDGTLPPAEPAWMRELHFDDYFRLIIEATPAPR